MRVFIDTSALLKKYIQEKGSEEFDDILTTVTDIVVSPTYVLEAYSAIERRLRQKDLTTDQSRLVRGEIKKDIIHFEQVVFDARLHEKAIQMIVTHAISTLDSIQLASACLSKTEMFITADKDLFRNAKEELKKVRLLE